MADHAQLRFASALQRCIGWRQNASRGPVSTSSRDVAVGRTTTCSLPSTSLSKSKRMDAPPSALWHDARVGPLTAAPSARRPYTSASAAIASRSPIGRLSRGWIHARLAGVPASAAHAGRQIAEPPSEAVWLAQTAAELPPGLQQGLQRDSSHPSCRSYAWARKVFGSSSLGSTYAHTKTCDMVQLTPVKSPLPPRGAP